MSDRNFHLDAVREPEEDPDLDTETPTTTVTPMTTARPPGATLHALLPQTLTTTSAGCSTSSISLFSAPSLPPPPPPPCLPIPRASNQYDQPAGMISEILPRLFISDIFTALDAATLRSFRITHIISVIEHALSFPFPCLSHEVSESRVSPGSVVQLDSRSHPAPALMTLHVSLGDLPTVDIFSYFATTRDFIVTALKDENTHILVHCYKGQSRSPTIVAAYLISQLKISANDAVKMIQTKRPMVLPNRGFMRQLKQWEEVVKEEDEMICSDK